MKKKKKIKTRLPTRRRMRYLSQPRADAQRYNTIDGVMFEDAAVFRETLYPGS